MVTNAEQELFLAKVKMILQEVEHFLAETLEKEHLSSKVVAVKTALSKQISDFKKQHPSLQTAWERVQLDADGTVRLKPFQKTPQPTAKQIVKPSVRVPASPKQPVVSKNDLQESIVQKRDKKAAKTHDKLPKPNAVQPPEAEADDQDGAIYELEPDDSSPVMPPTEDADPYKGMSFSDTDSENPYADVYDMKPSDLSNVPVQGCLMKKRRKDARSTFVARASAGLAVLFGPQKRWCALKDNMLYYFPKQTDGCQGKAIKMEGYTITNKSYETSSKSSIYPFVLVAPGKPTFEFIADSEAERLKWTNAISKLKRAASENRRDPPSPGEEVEIYEYAEDTPSNQPREVSLYDDIDTIRQKIQDGMMPKKTEDEYDEDVDLGLKRRSELPIGRNQGNQQELFYNNGDAEQEVQIYSNLPDNAPDDYPSEIYDEGETSRPIKAFEEENLYEETGGPANMASGNSTDNITGMLPVVDRQEDETPSDDANEEEVEDADPGPPAEPPPPIPSRNRPEPIPPVPQALSMRKSRAHFEESPSDKKADPPATQPKPKRNTSRLPTELEEVMRQRRAQVRDSNYGELT